MLQENDTVVSKAHTLLQCYSTMQLTARAFVFQYVVTAIEMSHRETVFAVPIFALTDRGNTCPWNIPRTLLLGVRVRAFKPLSPTHLTGHGKVFLLRRPTCC